jgi:RNA polymerase sigma factor (sigma-70 family)
MGINSFDINDRFLLLRAVCHEDREALGTLYLKYAPQVKAYIASHVDSVADTEDLAQEVFLQICRGKGHYDSSKGPEQYILGISTNIIRRYHRRKRMIRRSESVFIQSVSAIHSRNNIDKQLEKIVEAAENQLSNKERQAFRLRFVENLNPKEAAKKAGCSIRAFYKRLEKAEKVLREALKNKKR